MPWPFRLRRDAPPPDRYRLERPLADCPGCWKARAAAHLGAAVPCRECHRLHRGSWLRLCLGRR